MPSEEQWYTPTGLANAMMAKNLHAGPSRTTDTGVSLRP